MFILAIIVGVLAVIAFVVGVAFVGHGRTHLAKNDYDTDYAKGGRWTMLSAFAGLFLAAILAIFACMFTQDVGEARVLRDWTGEIVGEVTEPGLHWKAPWVDTIEFDIRNQPAIFIGNGTDAYNGQAPNGPQITFQDREGVTGNMDLVVIYSLRPDAVTDIYRQYQSQDNFRTRLIEQDIRSIPRDVAAKFGTLDMFTKRSDVAASVQRELEARWESQGVLVDSVSLQEIRYSDDVKARFDQAQQARIDVETSKAQLEKSKVDAEQKIVQAEAEAKANEALAKSLTEPILRQRYLDTLAKLAAAGNLVITDGTNSQILINK